MPSSLATAFLFTALICAILGLVVPALTCAGLALVLEGALFLAAGRSDDDGLGA